MTSSSPLPDGSPPSDARTSQPPAWAWILGLAGLIPFVMCAAMQWYGPPGWRMLAGLALLSYGAVIVSFLGGIHWGLAMRASPVPTPRLIWGVMPSLLGWSAVLLDSPWGPWRVGVDPAGLLCRRSQRLPDAGPVGLAAAARHLDLGGHRQRGAGRAGVLVGLAPTHEQGVELAHGDLAPGGAAVVALV